jgi:hypothetical protein
MTPRRHLWITVAALLVGAAALTARADDLSMWIDETFTIFHTTGSLEQILREADVNWPPGHYLAVYVWGNLTHFHDFALHALGVFFALIGAAGLARAARRLGGDWAAPLTVIAFATSGYTIYFAQEQRGYGQMFALIGVFVWLYLRWYAHPTRWRAVALWGAGAGLLYTHFIGGIVIGLAALHTLIGKPRRALGWLPIGIALSVVFLPMVPQLLRGLRLRGIVNVELPSYFRGPLESFYRAYSAGWDVPFALIVAVALIGLLGLLANRRIGAVTLGWLLAWAIGAPLVAYALREIAPFFTARYLSFTLPAAFLLIGVGTAGAMAALAARPRLRWLPAVPILVFVFAPYQPFEYRPRYTDGEPPVRDAVRELARQWRPGDAILLDPGCQCQSDGINWWYYERLYFPLGTIPRATLETLGDFRRVWHFVRQGAEDAATAAAVQQGRLNVGFFGPWYFIATAWEAPPMQEGVQVGEALRYHGADVRRRPLLHAGEPITVTGWWSSDGPLGDEIVLSAQVVGPSGELITQADGPPPTPFSAWTPGTLSAVTRTLHLPFNLPNGFYTIQWVAYRWTDGGRLVPAPSAVTGPESVLIADRARLISHDGD